MSSVRRHDPVAAQEPEALVDDLEDSLGDARLPVLLDARAAGCSGTASRSFEHQVRVLHLLGALDAVLVRELAQLVDRLRPGARSGSSAPSPSSWSRRERPGEDARVTARGVVGAAAGRRRGACRGAPRTAVRAASRIDRGAVGVLLRSWTASVGRIWSCRGDLDQGVEVTRRIGETDTTRQCVAWTQRR